MLFKTLAIISVFSVILLLKRFVNIFPSLMACFIRWKESINLEASVKHSLDRDMLAAAMILPFCLTADKFRLYSPGFMEGMGEGLHLAVTIGIFAAYLLIRAAASKAIHPRRMNPKTWKAAGRASFTFFIILTLALLAMAGSARFMDVTPEAMRNAMLWVSASIYALFLLRKIQIFASGCSLFAAFLYLCALEFFPTGALVASAIIF
jgi:hypothetical protein